MADSDIPKIEFLITDGPYRGEYRIAVTDLTASDVGDLLNAGGPDLDELLFGGGGKPGTRAIAGLVWVVRRRGNKGLAFRAVSDTINMGVIEAIQEPEGDATASGSMDPSDSADASSP
jgi:hypothetical protein